MDNLTYVTGNYGKYVSVKENESGVDSVTAFGFNSVIAFFYDIFTCIIKCEFIEWLITDPIEKLADVKSVLFTGAFRTVSDPALFMNLSF